MTTLLENLQWRHAVKAYSPNKKVPQESVEKIIEAARLAPTSSGLQPFEMIVIENQALKEQLSETALNPECMRNCSHVLVFAAWDNYTEQRIDNMYDFITDERELPRGRFNRYTTMLKQKVLKHTQAENFAHAARQTYIAMGLALAQAAELRVDTTPVEGFNNNILDELLELPQKGLKSVSLIYIGYADTEKDWLAPMKKVRRSKENMVHFIK
ncbi:NAD(P)H-dependent oxidoreductase [Spirabiliibacterium falconis]|uniref:NAD(P)H-dependent oxidoreductase n=1 Tax=Spirabiliibacterium falconis TaxID=572023 RepID=UPI001AAD43E1|nr:NAD(P)H-dependent oxidoreductase [Spirabiliibacterium falconis]MBE2894939.1 NAD(P)H-dependent oxidoreductase [Spirabiliibacterium falconis]